MPSGATTSSPVDHDGRWRPDLPDGPVCEHTFRGKRCGKAGAHYCEPRADRVVAFFPGILVHTSGPLKRQPFHLRAWQEHEIIRPLFGEVVWSAEWGCYVRRYRVAHIVVARKNGKSALVAGIVLYLVVGDDEEAAEVYGAAKDTKQAGKVFQPVNRMRQLSPRLNGDRGHGGRLQHNKNSRRIFDEQTASYYEVITSDAEGELGHNPHGFVLDEVLSQPDGSLWEAMVTAQGARLQPLYLAVTTETDDSRSFGAAMIDEAERVQENPARAPHVFAFVRKMPKTEDELQRLQAVYPDHPDLPVSIDWQDERNWKWPNPGLDEFKSRQALREARLEALNEPAKENGFRQFQLNQRVSQATRWMPMVLYEACSGDIWPTPQWGRDQLKGARGWFGFDLAARFDLTAWAVLIPAPGDDNVHALWRFWLPETALAKLDKAHDGAWSRWAAQGWLTVHEGDIIDYSRVYDDVTEDARHFKLVAGDCDQWSMDPVIQEIGKRTGIKEIAAYTNTYQRMSPGMKSVMAMVRTGVLEHHGNPVARFCFESVETRKAPYDPELIRPDKPDRDRSDKRIDAVPALAMAANALDRAPAVRASKRARVRGYH
jgi:phage terminase large subunit-like protein